MKTQNEPKAAISPPLLADPPRRRRGRRCLCWLLLLACGAAAWLHLSRPQPGNGGPAKIDYETEKAVLGDLTVNVTATGTLQPTNKVSVGSELSGIIEAVLADWNDRVKAGQILARLDVSKLKAQVRQTEASLAAAKARVLQAKATIDETSSKLHQLEKVRELSGGKQPSQADMDAAIAALARAKADKESAEAGVAEVEAKLAMSRTDLGKAEILSPVGGIVLSRNIEQGQTVAASFSAPVLFEIAEDLAKMELQVDVDEADIGQVREGQEAAFTVDAYPGRKFSARIRQVRFASTVTNGVVTYKTVLRVDNSGLVLRPGMTATAEIAVQKAAGVLLVPGAALRFSPQTQDKPQPRRSLLDALMPKPPRFSTRSSQRPAPAAAGQQSVWILKDGQPRQAPVKTGLSDGSRTQITEGEVRPDDLVITAATPAGRPQ